MSGVPDAVVRYGERYGSFMLNPLPTARTCETCLTFCGVGFRHCGACAGQPSQLDAVLPISYSVEREQLHHALGGYKGRHFEFNNETRRRFRFELAAVLWRFLARHERCAAAAANVPSFPVVTTVPSSRGVSSDQNPLVRIVAEHVGWTRDRFQPLLSRSDRALADHAFNPDRFRVACKLDGEPVLLIEDTWTTGAQAQSAAAALRAAGSGAVACVVIGRHIHRDYKDNGELLAALPEAFGWETCALHAR